MTIYSLDALIFLFATVCFSMSSSKCCFLTRIQISQKAGKVVWYSHLFKNFSQFVVIHKVKGLMFFWNSLAFSVIQWMLAIWSVSTACSKSSLYIWKFLVYVLWKPSLKDFEHYLASMWNEHNFAIVKQSMGSWRVRHDWATSLSLFTFLHWRRKWQPTPLFLPGECWGWESLVGCRLWDRTESEMTDAT